MRCSHNSRSILAGVAAAAASCVVRSVSGQEAIWHPAVNTTWQWQLQYRVNTSFDVDMYDVDLFDVNTTTFEEMKAEGSAVICYFSAGTKEDWRDDADDFPDEALGAALGDWEGEVWLDVNDVTVRSVMAARLDLAAEKGCDGVEPDNVQVYLEGNATGVNVTAAQQMDYSIFLANQAHARNLSIGLKNDLDHLIALEPYFDWAINESCFEYDECDGYEDTFIKAGKAVFHTEYEREDLDFCALASAFGMSSLLKSYKLGPERCSCQDPSSNYQCALLLETGEVPPPSSASSAETAAPTPAPTSPEDADPSSGVRRRVSSGMWTALTVAAAAALATVYP